MSSAKYISSQGRGPRLAVPMPTCPKGQLRARARPRRLLRRGPPTMYHRLALDRLAQHQGRAFAPARSTSPQVGGRRFARRRKGWSCTTPPWRCGSGASAAGMDHLVRNADGDELPVRAIQGARRALLRLRASAVQGRRRHRPAALDHVAGRDPVARPAARLNEQRRDPRRRTRLGPGGLLGLTRSTAMLETPRIDEAFKDQPVATRRVVGGGEAPRPRSPPSPIPQPAGCGGLAWRSGAGARLNAPTSGADEPPLSPAALAHTTWVGGPLRGLHLRAAAVRDRSGRAEGAVLPQQRRLRPGDLLPRRRFLQPRQHQARVITLPSCGFTHGPHPKALRQRARGGEAGDRRICRDAGYARMRWMPGRNGRVEMRALRTRG